MAADVAVVGTTESPPELSPGPRFQLDAAALLSVYVCLLLFIPTQLVFAPLGGSGSPAQIYALVLLAIWGGWRLRGQRRTAGSSSRLTLLLVAFVVATLASLVVALTRPINSLELSVVNLSTLTLAGWCGVFLVAAEGIGSLERLQTLARRVVAAGGVLATLGLVQWLTKQTIVDGLTIPGLTLTRPPFGVGLREGFSRPAGTASHPLEFGLVIAMLLPLALHFALEDRSRNALRRWYPAAAILALVPLSLSRSTLVGATAAGVVLFFSWDKRRRIRAAWALGLGAVVVFVTVPGLTGSLLGLFTSLSGDTSVSSRTDSYGLAWEFFTRNPLLGRGFGSFLPEYRILDNQMLGLLIEVGLIGTVVFAALLVSSVVIPLKARHRAATVRDRSLGTALGAALAAAACGLLTFDLLSFVMAAGLMFLLMGMAASYDGLTRATPTASAGSTRLSWSRTTIVILVAGATLTALVAARAYTAPGVYFARSYVTLVLPPTATDTNALIETTSGLVATAGLLARDIDPGLADGVVSGDVTLPDLGIDQGFLVRQRNLGGQWATNFADPVVEVEVTDSDPDRVRTTMAEVIDKVKADLTSRQTQLGVAPGDHIRTLINPASTEVTHVTGSRSRATLLVLLLGMLATATAVWAYARREAAQRRDDEPGLTRD